MKGSTQWANSGRVSCTYQKGYVLDHQVSSLRTYADEELCSLSVSLRPIILFHFTFGIGPSMCAERHILTIGKNSSDEKVYRILTD